MKSSTLHRSGLTKERMTMLENIKPKNLQNDEIPQYGEANKTVVNKVSELDVLYKGVEKGFTHAKASISKTPGVYLVVGFIAGAMFMLLVAGIVALSSTTPKQETKGQTQGVKVIETSSSEENASSVTEEKYTIKKGDTLDKIVYRIYGKYDNAKIEEIQTRNNITNLSRLQVGQVIVVPVPRNSD